MNKYRHIQRKTNPTSYLLMPANEKSKLITANIYISYLLILPHYLF